jgi:hypothetical protein
MSTKIPDMRRKTGSDDSLSPVEPHSKRASY